MNMNDFIRGKTSPAPQQHSEQKQGANNAMNDFVRGRSTPPAEQAQGRVPVDVMERLELYVDKGVPYAEARILVGLPEPTAGGPVPHPPGGAGNGTGNPDPAPANPNDAIRRVIQLRRALWK